MFKPAAGRRRKSGQMFRVAIPVSKRYHARPMTQIDSEKEHQRLVARYAAMEDGELEKVALDFLSLTEVAKSVLHSEMSRRDLTPPAEIAANHANEIAESEARKPVMIRRYRDLPEASIAKSVLESAGVDCILADWSGSTGFIPILSAASNCWFPKKMPRPPSSCWTKAHPRNLLLRESENTSNRTVRSAVRWIFPWTD